MCPMVQATARQDVRQVCDTLGEALAQAGHCGTVFTSSLMPVMLAAVAEDGQGGRLQAWS